MVFGVVASYRDEDLSQVLGVHVEDFVCSSFPQYFDHIALPSLGCHRHNAISPRQQYHRQNQIRPVSGAVFYGGQ